MEVTPVVNETPRYLRVRRVEGLHKKRGSRRISGRAHRQMYQGFLMVDQVDPRLGCLQSLAFLETFLSVNVSSSGARSILDQREGKREGALQGGRAGGRRARGWAAEVCGPLTDGGHVQGKLLFNSHYLAGACSVLLVVAKDWIWYRRCLILVQMRPRVYWRLTYYTKMSQETIYNLTGIILIKTNSCLITRCGLNE